MQLFKYFKGFYDKKNRILHMKIANTHRQKIDISQKKEKIVFVVFAFLCDKNSKFNVLFRDCLETCFGDFLYNATFGIGIGFLFFSDYVRKWHYKYIYFNK